MVVGQLQSEADRRGLIAEAANRAQVKVAGLGFALVVFEERRHAVSGCAEAIEVVVALGKAQRRQLRVVAWRRRTSGSNAARACAQRRALNSASARSRSSFCWLDDCRA
jgi:hypothetical protein